MQRSEQQLLDAAQHSFLLPDEYESD